MKSLGSAFLLSVLSLALTSCLSSGFSSSDNPNSTGDNTPTLKSTSITTGTYTDYAAIARDYEMFKVEYGSTNPTFMQWIPNKTNTTAGAVLVYLPYEGISWSGESIDATWVAKGNGAQNDSDSPYYDPATSSQISFTVITPTNSGAEGFPYSFNGLHVLVVFSRFYTGGSVQNNIEDVMNGMRFLHSQALVDKTKIGFSSGSWGGIGLLQAAAQLGASMQPKAIALQYPVSDLKKLNNYITVDIPTATVNPTTRLAYSTFFDPYLRRINKATEALAGQSTRYDNYSHIKLSSISADMFVAHDDWDTLVPASQTVDLLSSVASTNKTVYYHRRTGTVDYDTAALNHSQAADTMTRDSIMGWNYTFLITGLTSSASTRTSFYNGTHTAAQLWYTKNQKIAGSNTTFYNKVLALFCEPNLVLSDASVLNAGSSGAGKDVLAYLMNTYYQVGWAADGDAACAQLTSAPPF